MSEQMITELIDMLKSDRNLHKEAPFLSDFENGCNEGANNILDNVERILSKYVDIPKYELEQLSKEPKTIWGRMVFSNNTYTNNQYLQFIEEVLNFDTKDHIEERKNDKTQWDEFQDEQSYWIDALFSEKEANHLMLRFKGSFLLLEDTLNQEGIRELIDAEWIRAYQEEEKTIYGKKPTAPQILSSWKQNKEYFLANKGKPFGVIHISQDTASMTYLQKKMTNLIGKEIETAFGPCEVLSVNDKHVKLKDVGENEFDVELWRFNG